MSVPKPAPKPMPVGREHYQLKQRSSLVDLMIPLINQQLDNAKFVKYLEAQFDEHAVTGKVLLDRDRAVVIAMDKASEDSPLHQEKQSTLITVLNRARRKFVEKDDDAVNDDDTTE